MFPGFVTVYRDKNNYIHLFFFPGLNKDGSFVYRDLNIDRIRLKYTLIKNNDSSLEFVFKDKNIKKVICKLLKTDNSIDYETISL